MNGSDIHPNEQPEFAPAPTPAAGESSGVATAPGKARHPAGTAVSVENLHCSYGRIEAVHGLSFHVSPGQCYGLFGRNGAGKSTTIKAMLNLLRPRSGSIKVHGISPQKDELAVKRLIGYVPEQVAFHPWMTVEKVLRYCEAFRPTWNRALETELLDRFDLARDKRTEDMSKGMRSQLGLICAVCPEPAILLLDEPTSGLDPIIRREFLQTVIGAYLESDPGHRTVLVSTHLIGEWEGLIDQFTIVEKGRALLSTDTETARKTCRRIYLRWTGAPASIPPDLGRVEADRGAAASDQGRLVRVITRNFTEETPARLQALGTEVVEVEPLSLEDIFVAISGLSSQERAAVPEAAS